MSQPGLIINVTSYTTSPITGVAGEEDSCSTDGEADLDEIAIDGFAHENPGELADARLERAHLETCITWEAPQIGHGHFAMDFAPVFGALEAAFAHVIIDARAFVESVLAHGNPYCGSPGIGVFQSYEGFVGSLRFHEGSVGGRFVKTGEDQFRDQWIGKGSVISGTCPFTFGNADAHLKLTVTLAHYDRITRDRTILVSQLGGARPVVSNSSLMWEEDLALRIKQALLGRLG